MNSKKLFGARKSHDVIVVGGGVAGVAAALAARRLGASVLLLEKRCEHGGLATAGLVNLFVPLCNGRGIPIMRGMAEEFLRSSVKFGFDSLNEAWKDGVPEETTNLRYATFFSAKIFALQMVEMLAAEGVDFFFEATVADVELKGGRCTGVSVLCEEGMNFFPGKAVVDASGSSLVFHRAGAETELGKNYFSYHAHAISLEGCACAVERGNIRYALNWQQGGEANLYGKNHPEGMRLFYGDTSGNITDYLVENQLRLLEKLKATPRLSRTPVALPSMPQLRTIRRIIGEYTLTNADIYRHFDDSVTALCDSERRDSLYEIPYRSLYDHRFPNLIAAGRNIASAGYLWDVTRVIPPAIVTGQAAGTAAAMAVCAGCSIPALPVEKLQQELARQQVLIHFEDRWIPRERTAGEYSPASQSDPDRQKDSAR